MRISVESFVVFAAADATIQAFHLEEPRRNFSSDSFGLPFRGWYIAKDARVSAISIDVYGEPIDTVSPVARPDVVKTNSDVNPDFVGGFEAVVPTMGLAGRLEVSVMAHFAGYSVCAAKILLIITPIVVDCCPAFTPILLTTGGRMGSSMTMKLISSHPEIVTQDRFPYEDKSALFWMRAAAVLSTPADLIRSTRGIEFELQRFFIGYSPFFHNTNLPNMNAKAARWARETLPKSCYKFFMSLIDGYYDSVAQDCRKPSAKFFVEKASHGALPSMMRELYPQSKEVFLIRDPRDVVVSIREFNKRRGFDDFGADKFDSDSGFVSYLGGALKGMLVEWTRRRESSFLLRYEDLVAEPEETTRQLFGYIGVPNGSDIVSAALERILSVDDSSRYHITSSSIEHSVGRWKTELPETLREMCNCEFRPFLDHFGYH